MLFGRPEYCSFFIKSGKLNKNIWRQGMPSDPTEFMHEVAEGWSRKGNYYILWGLGGLRACRDKPWLIWTFSGNFILNYHFLFEFLLTSDTWNLSIWRGSIFKLRESISEAKVDFFFQLIRLKRWLKLLLFQFAEVGV